MHHSLCHPSVLEDQRLHAHQAFPAVQEDPGLRGHRGLQHLPEEEQGGEEREQKQEVKKKYNEKIQLNHLLVAVWF